MLQKTEETADEWRYRAPGFRERLSLKALGTFTCRWLAGQVPLFEAFWVAVSFHLLLVPVIWVAGWILPWPKSPPVTTVIEFDLSDWPRQARTGKIVKFRDPGH